MVAHDLIFFVGQCQRWGHSDGITCVHAHWIDVFDGADDDGVVSSVADHFHLELFPANQGLVHKDLTHRGSVHASAAEVFVIFAVVGDAAACAAHGKRRANDGRQADIIKCINGQSNARSKVLFAVVTDWSSDDCSFGIFDAKAVHGFAEQLAIFCHFNGFAFRADHFDVEFLQDTHFLKRKRGV